MSDVYGLRTYNNIDVQPRVFPMCNIASVIYNLDEGGCKYVCRDGREARDKPGVPRYRGRAVMGDKSKGVFRGWGKGSCPAQHYKYLGGRWERRNGN